MSDYTILKSPKTVQGKIEPADQIEVYTLEEVDLDCRFAPNKLTEGARIARFFAEFNFQTMGYVKSYFIDLERLRSLRRAEIDPFQEYGITETEPIAVYTNGPVMIGIYTPPLIGVSKTTSVQPRLGITLSNQWSGTIKRVNSLKIKTHESIKLDDCTQKMTQSGTEIDNNINYNVFVLDKAITESIKDFKTINCRMTFDVDKLLEKTPITTRYFKVTAEYDYIVDESTTVTIEGTEEDKAAETVGAVGAASESMIGVYEKYKGFIQEANKAYPNISQCLILATIYRESSGNWKAISEAGAVGLMQLMPTTAIELDMITQVYRIDEAREIEKITNEEEKNAKRREYANYLGQLTGTPGELMQIDHRFDPLRNIFAGTQYLSNNFNSLSSDYLKEELIERTIMSYYAGLGNIKPKDIFPTKPTLKTKVQDYARAVMTYKKQCDASNIVSSVS